MATGYNKHLPCKRALTISAFYIVFDISRPDSASICTCLHVCVWLWLCLNVCLCGSHFSDPLVFVFFGSFVGHIGHRILQFTQTPRTASSTLWSWPTGQQFLSLCFALDCISTSYAGHTHPHTHTCIATATEYLSYVGHCGCGTRVSASIVLRVVLRIHPAFMTQPHTHTPN